MYVCIRIAFCVRIIYVCSFASSNTTCVHVAADGLEYEYIYFNIYVCNVIFICVNVLYLRYYIQYLIELFFFF